jgi:hypothetical protein
MLSITIIIENSKLRRLPGERRLQRRAIPLENLLDPPAQPYMRDVLVRLLQQIHEQRPLVDLRDPIPANYAKPCQMRIANAAAIDAEHYQPGILAKNEISSEVVHVNGTADVKALMVA